MDGLPQVEYVAFTKPLVHFLDCLHCALVEYFKTLDAILSKERACNESVHPVESLVEGGLLLLVIASLPYAPCRKLELHISQEGKMELAIGVENTFSEH